MSTLHDSRFTIQSPSLFVAGATATGKSEIALLMAERLGGEIISVDSMQVYRGLDIGTAKPTPAERARVVHHLIDVVDVSDPFDAAHFVALARAAEQDIRARGRLPLFCGGTGLYFKAYLEGIGGAPPSNARVRTELESMSLAAMLEELAAKDPATFAKIDRQNPRRVVRALEVIRLTGQPFSAQRAPWRRPDDVAPFPFVPGSSRVLGLARRSDDLRARIDARVDAMFARGLVEETQALLRRGLEFNRSAMQAIGYRQVVEHLRGERPLADTIAQVKQRTRQFAKRQMTWFRRQLPVQWIEVSPGEEPGSVAARVIDAFTTSAATRA